MHWLACCQISSATYVCPLPCIEMQKLIEYECQEASNLCVLQAYRLQEKGAVILDM